jgi:lysophospholipase L1-like esterase
MSSYQRALNTFPIHSTIRWPHFPICNEADRLAVNQWIRDPAHFDAAIDFDKLMADPSQPDRLLRAYDSGDHLHPSVEGYRAMGEAVPLTLFGR